MRGIMKNSLKAFIATTVTAGILLSSAPAAHATTTQATCVDGSVRSNLKVTWKTGADMTVETKTGGNLCDDVTLYLSSYTMPDNYNGEPVVGNPTASPQHQFDSQKAVLKKGTNKVTAMKIDVPKACKNVQIDLYYGPEIVTVGLAGHGQQYISGYKTLKTTEPCETATPVTEVPTEEAQTPETPAPEVVVEQPAIEAPVEVAKTGPEAFAAVGTLLTTGAYAATSFLANRRR
jgi:hypothetical protein